MATEIILKGIVQGVCCRMYCRQVAKALALRGTASNLYNGNVQVILSTNDQQKVQMYINALRTNKFGYSFYGSITDVKYGPYEGPVDGDYIW